MNYILQTTIIQVLYTEYYFIVFTLYSAGWERDIWHFTFELSDRRAKGLVFSKKTVRLIAEIERLSIVARATGLEPVTYGLTVRCSTD